MSEADYLSTLNAEQRQAVQYGARDCASSENGPLLIIAGAGTGKTNTLAYRVARLVVDGDDPARILLLTFSRRAAMELERRVGEVLGRVLKPLSRMPHVKLPWAGTFHSVGARLLREYAERIGLNAAFSILDRGDAEDLLALVRHDLRLSTTKERFPSKATCLGIYSHVINSQLPVDRVLAHAFPAHAHWETELKRLFAAYVAAKQEQNVLDYDDLLLHCASMVDDPEFASDIGGRFDHILVDEYQDTNRLQASLLLALKPDGKGVTVVGDDAQSIYSFRAATVRNILEFPESFAVRARVVTLERNYRSTQPILDAANAVIGLAPERFAKNLRSERCSSRKPRLVSVADGGDQARYVADRVLEHRESGIALQSQAVLFRSSSHSAEVELELARRGIPFVKYGGLKFLEASHVKDVLSVLRWADNPRNRMAGFRGVSLLPGIGPATAGRVLDAAIAAPDPASVIQAFRMPAAAETDWAALLALLRGLGDRNGEWPADLDCVVQWYAPHLERIHEDAHVRRRDLVQLLEIATTYPSRERFLTELTLDPPEAASDEAGPPRRDDDYLILSTIHSAKGQEWKSVHVLNVVDGCIPSDMATGTSAEIEEERRLLYVAMTHAKDHLELMLPLRFYIERQARFGDAHVYAQRTRFIPDAIGGFFESDAWPSRMVAERGPADLGKPVATLDVAARARALWQ